MCARACTVTASAHALADHLVSRVVAEAAADGGDRRQRRVPEWLFERLLAGGADVGEAHAVGGQQRGERMDQHLGHAERIRHQAGVLAAGAAEAIERVARHVVAALQGDFLIAFAMFSTAIRMKPSADFFG